MVAYLQLYLGTLFKCRVCISDTLPYDAGAAYPSPTLHSRDVVKRQGARKCALELVSGKKTEEPEEERSASQGYVPCFVLPL